MKIEFNGSVEEYKKFLNTEIKKINNIEEFNYIDLGLPSGTLWGKYNVGASSEEVFGNYLTYDEAVENFSNVPSIEQLEELTEHCAWEWCEINGIRGYKVTGNNGNSIFLPAAGYRSGSSFYYVGTYGYYWGSTPYASDASNASYMSFYASGVYVNYYYNRYNARPVRLVRSDQN